VRFVCASLVAGICLALLATPVVASSAAACDPVAHTGGWEVLPAPTFPAGEPQELIDHAVVADDPDRVVVTNGRSVAVSVDGAAPGRSC
jgi:hypothetical protein